MKNITLVYFNSCLNTIQEIKYLFSSTKLHAASSKSNHNINGVNGISQQELKNPTDYFFSSQKLCVVLTSTQNCKNPAHSTRVKQSRSLLHGLGEKNPELVS